MVVVHQLHPLTRSVHSRPQLARHSLTGRAAPRSRFGGGRGGVLDHPGLDVGKRLGWDSDKDLPLYPGLPILEIGRGSGNTSRQLNAPPGGGNYRVLLLDSPKHTQKAVVKAILAVVPGADEGHALNCFHTSKQLGMAIITSALKEHAEFYQEQFFQWGLRTTVEPDSTTA